MTYTLCVLDTAKNDDKQSAHNLNHYQAQEQTLVPVYETSEQTKEHQADDRYAHDKDKDQKVCTSVSVPIIIIVLIVINSSVSFTILVYSSSVTTYLKDDNKRVNIQHQIYNLRA